MASAWYLYGYMSESSLFGGGFIWALSGAVPESLLSPMQQLFLFIFLIFLKKGLLSVKYEYKLIEKMILAL